MNSKKCVTLINKCIDLLNKGKLEEKEFVLFLSQLMIRVGKTLYDPDNAIGQKIDWIKLDREYYTSKEPNIGLGLMLNGGQMMNILIENNKNGETKNGKISTGAQAPQEDGRTTVQPTEARRRNRR